MLGYYYWLVVWNPLFLDPSDGVFGRFDLAALCGCHTLGVCYVMFCCRSSLRKCWVASKHGNLVI